MLTVEIYRKNYKKIKAVNILEDEVKQQADIRKALIQKIDSVMTMAWKRVRIGFKENSLLVNKQVLLEIIPPQIENDLIKMGILEILREEVFGFDFAPIKDEIPINRKIIYPDNNFQEINLVKLFAFTSRGSENFALCYLLSIGQEGQLSQNNIFFNMIKEQVDKEAKILLKRMIKTIKKDIKVKRKLDERLRKRLEPYIVADKI